MSYFAMNAQEEALKVIAKQMYVRNKLELFDKMYQLGAISKEDYIKRIGELVRYC